MVISPSTWAPPPTIFFKLNFYGTSKCNPDPTGLGGSFNNDNGQLLWLFVDFIGIRNNNVTKIQALEKGLNITIQEGFEKLVVEGDSQIIIQMPKKLQRGSPSAKYLLDGGSKVVWKIFNLISPCLKS
jgi:ribonuclease HI